MCEIPCSRRAGPFWQAEHALAQAPGVLRSGVGFANGRSPDPDFDDVVAGETDHCLAVQLLFDKTLTSHEELLQAFWEFVQTPDVQDRPQGHQTRCGVFYHTEEQKAAAEAFLVRTRLLCELTMRLADGTMLARAVFCVSCMRPVFNVVPGHLLLSLCSRCILVVQLPLFLPHADGKAARGRSRGNRLRAPDRFQLGGRIPSAVHCRWR
jgi:Peptide methionine sulfoxide reductase